MVAVQLARLLGRPVPFFTALGRDATGERAAARLTELGLDLHVAWREPPTRRGVSFVDDRGDRSITVIGQRLSPTAADAAALRACRAATVLAATPRLGLALMQQAGVALDALIGSGLDPGEAVPAGALQPPAAWPSPAVALPHRP